MQQVVAGVAGVVRAMQLDVSLALSEAAGMARVLAIKVKPNARDSVLEQDAAGHWNARLRAPPVDGKANAALLALVAAHFDVPRSRVSIVGGATGRSKRVRIDD
jgi:uncharacterized protein (TIGR00251 family)